MNPQEKSALKNFLQAMSQVRLERKDTEADAMIRQAAQAQPDALYLLTQRALLQEEALRESQQTIAELQRQIEQMAANGGPGASSAAGSFLGSASQWGRSANAQDKPAAAAYRPGAVAPLAAQQEVPAPASARPGLLGGGGSFLGSMAGVLAGAAAGHFLFQGIGHMMQANSDSKPNQQASEAQNGGQPLADNALARDAGLNDVNRPDEQASSQEPAQWQEADGSNWSDAGFDDGGFDEGGDYG